MALISDSGHDDAVPLTPGTRVSVKCRPINMGQSYVSTTAYDGVVLGRDTTVLCLDVYDVIIDGDRQRLPVPDTRCVPWAVIVTVRVAA